MRDYRPGQPRPLLVYGLTAESFRAPAIGQGTRGAPKLLKQFHGALPERDRAVERRLSAQRQLRREWNIASARDISKLLWTMQTVGLSARQVWHRYSPASHNREAQRNAQRIPSWPYGANGVLLDRPRDKRIMRTPAMHKAGVARTVEEFSGFYRSSGSRLDRRTRHLFEQLLARANDAGVTPVIVLLPMSPALSAELDDDGRPQRIAAVRRYLESLTKRYRFELHDYSTDAFGTTADAGQAWLDGAHPSSRTTRTVLARLAADSPQLQRSRTQRSTDTSSGGND